MAQHEAGHCKAHMLITHLRLQVRDWYVESFKDLREFPVIKDDNDEQKFTDLLRHIYHRHRHVVPVMAMGVAELKKELQEGVGLLEMPEIHQFLDGFYLSRIGIRILIGQHIALHEPEKENYIGKAEEACSQAAWTILLRKSPYSICAIIHAVCFQMLAYSFSHRSSACWHSLQRSIHACSALTVPAVLKIVCSCRYDWHQMLAITNCGGRSDGRALNLHARVCLCTRGQHLRGPKLHFPVCSQPSASHVL